MLSSALHLARQSCLFSAVCRVVRLVVSKLRVAKLGSGVHVEAPRTS